MQALLKLLTSWLLLSLLALPAAPSRAADRPTPFVVVAHASVGRVDAATLQRLYTGRAIEVAGVPVTAVNFTSGSALRDRFLADVVEMPNDRYAAYWTVRRHVGKGVPPRELKTSADVIDFVQTTPGGLGYIPAGDLRPGLNVIFKP